MNLSKESFKAIGKNFSLTDQQLDAFWNALEQREESGFAKYLYYFGALLTISAMTWLMNAGWEAFGGLGLFFIAVAYSIGFTLIGNALWNKNNLRIPAGLLITMAVCMTPLAIYGLQWHFNGTPTQEPHPLFFRWFDTQWLWIELGTILAGCIALRFFPFPFLMAPITLAAFYLSMDIVPQLFGKDPSTDAQAWIAIVFGLLFIAIGLKLDQLKKRDYAFWSYLFGALSFWGGLGTLSWMASEWVMGLYALVNLLMMSFSILIKRTIFMILGAIGIFLYLEHLVDKFFADSIFFPFILTAIGLLIIYLGILYQRHAPRIEGNLRKYLPASFQSFLDDNISN